MSEPPKKAGRPPKRRDEPLALTKLYSTAEWRRWLVRVSGGDPLGFIEGAVAARAKREKLEPPPDRLE